MLSNVEINEIVPQSEVSDCGNRNYISINLWRLYIPETNKIAPITSVQISVGFRELLTWGGFKDPVPWLAGRPCQRCKRSASFNLLPTAGPLASAPSVHSGFMVREKRAFGMNL